MTSGLRRVLEIGQGIPIVQPDLEWSKHDHAECARNLCAGLTADSRHVDGDNVRHGLAKMAEVQHYTVGHVDFLHVSIDSFHVDPGRTVDFGYLLRSAEGKRVVERTRVQKEK